MLSEEYASLEHLCVRERREGRERRGDEKARRSGRRGGQGGAENERGPGGAEG